MDSNHKNLRDKLNTPPTDLPEELSWANMKEGIASKMQDAQNKSNGRPSRRGQVYLLAIILILLGLLLIQMCGHLSWTTQETEAIPQAAFAVQEESSGFTYEITVVGEEHLQARSKASKGAHRPTAASKNQSTPANRELRMENNTSARDTDHGLQGELAGEPDRASDGVSAGVFGLASEETDAEVSAQNSEQVFPSMAAADKPNSAAVEAAPTDLVVDNSPTTAMSSSALQATLEAIARLDLMPIGLLEDRATTQLMAPAPAFTAPSPVSHRKHSLVFSSGISVWDPGYSNTLPERATFESDQLSFSHQFKYEYHMDNNLFFTTGLRMHLLESRFDWSAPINDYKITLEDVVVERVTDALRGEVEEIRGDVEVPVDAERVVRHYNRTTLFQLPFGLGMSRTVGPIDFSFELGSSINIVGNSQGRTLDEGAVIDLDASDQDLFDSQWGIHGFAGLRMHYLFHDHWNVNLGAYYQKALSNWSVEENTGMRPQIMTLEVGLGYRL
jgi:hypothetical protein